MRPGAREGRESRIITVMGEAAVQLQRERRRREGGRKASRTAILEAARRVAARDGARDLSLRGVAAEAGFAPAALYGYFRNKDELLLALAAEDLTNLARVMKGSDGLAAAGAAALDLLRGAETMAAASAALAEGAPELNEAERLFNGRLIAALKALSDVSGLPLQGRESQCDVVLIASAVAGLALLARSGRLEALGFSPDEMIARLDARFRKG
jgi:AcrR family transcriptional regulator